MRLLLFIALLIPSQSLSFDLVSEAYKLSIKDKIEVLESEIKTLDEENLNLERELSAVRSTTDDFDQVVDLEMRVVKNRLDRSSKFLDLSSLKIELESSTK